MRRLMLSRSRQGAGVQPLGVKRRGPCESPEPSPVREQSDRTRQGHRAERERDGEAMPESQRGAGNRSRGRGNRQCDRR